MNTKMRILDYEEVLSELDRITSNPEFQKQPSEHTECDSIEIPYYTLGHGDNHIVVCGGTHGSEIISVDFVLRLMDSMGNRKGPFKDLDLDKYTFHFIPVHNPEGYIISTSAIRTLIGREATEDEIEKISKEYFMAYRQDDINAKNNPEDKSQKNHQKMFEQATYECIPEKYPMLREKVKEIYSNPEVPKGSIVVHRGNGLGQETNRSLLYRALLDENASSYGPNRYNNININIPGPLGVAPTRDILVENKFLRQLLERLYKEGKYCGMLSYHGTGGMIYSKLSNDDELLIDEDLPEEYQRDKYIKSVINRALATKYHDDTKYITPNGSEKPGYRIVKDPSLKDMDETFRLDFPAVLLIELSYMGGNPIGPLGDRENNYNPTMEHNLEAAAHFFEYCRILKGAMYGTVDLIDKDVSEEWEEEHKFSR